MVYSMFFYYGLLQIVMENLLNFLCNVQCVLCNVMCKCNKQISNTYGWQCTSNPICRGFLKPDVSKRGT